MKVLEHEDPLRSPEEDAMWVSQDGLGNRRLCQFSPNQSWMPFFFFFLIRVM